MKLNLYCDKTATAEIVEIGKRMYRNGYAPANAGNISIRINENEIWTTPSGVSKGFLSEEVLVKTTLDGTVLCGSSKPSSELKMHLSLYRAFPEIRAVVHAHPPVATAFAVAGMSLDQAYLQEMVVQLGVIPVVPYALPGTEILAEKVAEYCHAYNGLLLEHHGAVTWGNTAEQAFYKMESIEHAAIVAMYLRVMGEERPMTNEQIEELIDLRSVWGVTGGGRPKGR